MSDSDACEVPFCEQLRSVPKEFRASREIQWAEDGTPTGHQFIPVGFMVHRAADAIDAQEKRIKELEGVLEAVDDLIQYQYSGSREAMTYLTQTCDRAREALK